MPDGSTQLVEWRRAKRKELLAQRQELPRNARSLCTAAITALLEQHGPVLDGSSIGFYWPIRGEVDLVPFVRQALRQARAAALPVVVERAKPLEFWRWTARTELVSRSIWNIPCPAERVLVEPDILLVPLLGFDEQGYRLGYGSGYYDRTLAASSPRPITIGIGHELGRLRTIHPQAHDIPLDAIVTEHGLTHVSDALTRL